MGVEVAELADDVEKEGWVDDCGCEGGGFVGGGLVDPVCHVQACEEPVVCAVFEDVG